MESNAVYYFVRMPSNVYRMKVPLSFLIVRAIMNVLIIHQINEFIADLRKLSNCCVQLVQLDLPSVARSASVLSIRSLFLKDRCPKFNTIFSKRLKAGCTVLIASFRHLYSPGEPHFRKNRAECS